MKTDSLLGSTDLQFIPYCGKVHPNSQVQWQLTKTQGALNRVGENAVSP